MFILYLISRVISKRHPQSILFCYKAYIKPTVTTMKLEGERDSRCWRDYSEAGDISSV